VVLISSNVLGRGDDNLGAMLMKSFMYTLTQMQGEIRTMLFMNSGVLVTTGGSELIEHIKLLENHGVEILSCGTCLDFYHMTDKLMVGSVTNMYTIAEKLMHADRVITF
jgi:selenium metabolism protein YedF